MPNRIIRVGLIDSDRVNSLSAEGERMLHRMMLACDDAGRLDGRPVMLLSACFPSSPGVTTDHIERWIAECVAKGLCTAYSFDGKAFLQLYRWQRCGRSTTSRFPWSDGSFTITYVKTQTRDGVKDVVSTSIPTATRAPHADGVGMGSAPQTDGIGTPSAPHVDGITTETNTETETETETDGGSIPQTPSVIAEVPKRRRRKGPEPSEIAQLIPRALDTPEFRTAWKNWQQHRREIKKPLTPTAAEMRLKQLIPIGPAEAVRWIENAIANSWQGIYPPKDGLPAKGASWEEEEYTEEEIARQKRLLAELDAEEMGAVATGIAGSVPA